MDLSWFCQLVSSGCWAECDGLQCFGKAFVLHNDYNIYSGQNSLCNRCQVSHTFPMTCKVHPTVNNKGATITK